MPEPTNEGGIVYLIGAGPGDPGLLTLRGAQLLSRCDVVLYDGLSNAQLLSHAKNAQHICVGKHGQKRIWRQEEIIEEMLAHARKGLKVVRLKGGDPAVFARTAEEVDALREANLPFEVVPGITAALAAGSYAGIPITHRKLASAVALITGHEEPGKSKSALDWDALAKFPGTLVIYMGVTTAGVWTKALLDAGKSPDTPAALIRRCSHRDQRTVHCRLDEVADRLTPASKFRPPVIVIRGPVTQLAETMNWLEHKPLFGQTVLVTRPADQAESLASPLQELGANVLLQPAIEIGPPADWSEVDDVIGRLKEIDTLVFCSRNGVRYFMDRLLQQNDIRALAGVDLAVVGSQTSRALAQYHVRPSVVPPDFTARSLATILAGDAKGKRIVVLRASRGDDVFTDRLTQAGATVTSAVAYQHTDVTQADEKVSEAINSGQVDWVTMTSSATAVSLCKLFGDAIKKTKIASLSPVTTKAILGLGYHVHAEADPYTAESLAQAIANTLDH